MKMTSGLTKLACAIAMTIATALPVHADIIALDSTRATGNQSWTGALGMDFDVLAPIWVTQLGAYDSDANGFVNSISVGIFSRTSQSLVGTSAVLTTANTTINPIGGRNRFFDIVDFLLPVGQYSIVADGFSSSDQNGNTNGGAGGPFVNTGDGLISFTGKSRYGNLDTAFVYPLNLDGGPANRYDAGTFQFTEVPEPGTLALLGLGLLGAGLMRRRK